MVEENEDEENELLIGYASLVFKMMKITHKDRYEDFLGEKVDSFVYYLVHECLLSV